MCQEVACCKSQITSHQGLYQIYTESDWNNRKPSEMPIFIYVLLPVPFIISSDMKLSLSPTLLPFPIIHIFSNASLNSTECRMSPTNKKLLQLSFNLYATPICLYSSHLASMMTSDVLWVQRTDYRKRINKMKTLKGDKDGGWLQ